MFVSDGVPSQEEEIWVCLMWCLQRSGNISSVVSDDVVRRAQCIMGKENIWPYEHGWLRVQPCCPDIRPHMYAHTHTHSEMGGGFTFSVLNCLDSFYGLNGSWRMVKQKRREREDQKREKMTESERGDEVQRKKEEKKKGVKAETCFCADTCKHLVMLGFLAHGGLQRSWCEHCQNLPPVFVCIYHKLRLAEQSGRRAVVWPV